MSTPGDEDYYGEKSAKPELKPQPGPPALPLGWMRAKQHDIQGNPAYEHRGHVAHQMTDRRHRKPRFYWLCCAKEFKSPSSLHPHSNRKEPT